MTSFLLPLIVFIIGLAQIAEAVYSPSLPDIAHALQASESMVEYTLTIYLVGFAIGVLFWGKLSDKFGRKPCVLAGLAVFILGCIGCYFSTGIETLMINRFIQAFGGSIGSVLGQAICRDVFQGPSLGKAYSSIGAAIAVFPAIGPVIGGVIAQNFGWPSIFLFLIAFAVLLSIAVIFRLPETHHKENRVQISIREVALKLCMDKKVIACALIVGATNGITFSYFAEGPFYLIKLLGMSPTTYGLSFLAIAASTILGGMLSRRMHKNHSSKAIMSYGIMIIFITTVIFSLISLLHTGITPLPNHVMIIITIITQMGVMFGVCMATSNALALSLVDYKWCIGTASSLFGFSYYALISLFTLWMGMLHNGTLLPMPLYFLGISVFMLLVKRTMLRDDVSKA